MTEPQKDVRRSARQGRGGGPPRSLVFLTNQMNLQEILSTGLIKPQSGYPPGKYYRDLLEGCPGGVLFFLDRLPQKALDLVTAEQDFLTPVTIRIDGSRLAAGPIRAMDGQGRALTVNWPPGPEMNPAALVIDGILPVCLVKDICFTSDTEKQLFIDQSRQISNLTLDWFCLRAFKGLGARVVKSFPGFPESFSDPVNGPDWPAFLETEARGGVLAALLLSAGEGSPNISLAGDLFGQPPAGFLDGRAADPAWSVPLAWLRAEPAPRTLGPEWKILWSLLDYLAPREHREDPPGPGLIRVLQAGAAECDPAFQALLLPAMEKIKRLTEIGDEPAEIFLKQSRSPVLSGLFLFLLKKNSRRLYRPQNDPPVTTDALFVARVLCGAWEGWTELAGSERRSRDLQDAVSYFMALWHNRRFDRKIDLGPAPPLPLFPGHKTGWQQPRLF